MKDGSYILYVNGGYRGDTEPGKLMHDFNCTSADEMIIKPLADKTKYYKEHQEGVTEMCRMLEQMREDSYDEGIAKGREIGVAEGREIGAEEQAKAIAKAMYAGKFSLEIIVQMTGYSEEILRAWLEE